MNMEKVAGWDIVEGKLQRRFEFKDFEEAMKFVNKVADIAESVDHHPDIFISYKRVTLTLWTHSAGAVTEKDHSLAKKINEIRA